MRITIEDTKDFPELLRAVAELGQVFNVIVVPDSTSEGNRVTVTAQLRDN